MSSTGCEISLLGNLNAAQQTHALLFALRNKEGKLTGKIAKGIVEEIFELPSSEKRYLVRYHLLGVNNPLFNQNKILLNDRTRVHPLIGSIGRKIIPLKRVDDFGSYDQSLDPDDGIEDGFGFTVISPVPGIIDEVVARVETGRRKKDEYCKAIAEFRTKYLSDPADLSSYTEKLARLNSNYAAPLFTPNQPFELDFTERIPGDQKDTIFAPIEAEIRRQITIQGLKPPTDNLTRRLFFIDQKSFRNVLLQELDLWGQEELHVHKPSKVVRVLHNRLVMINFDYMHSAPNTGMSLEERVAFIGTLGLWDSLAYKEMWHPCEVNMRPEFYLKRDGLHTQPLYPFSLESLVEGYDGVSRSFFEGFGVLQAELLMDLTKNTLRNVGVTSSSQPIDREESFLETISKIAGSGMLLRALLIKSGFSELHHKLEKVQLGCNTYDDGLLNIAQAYRSTAITGTARSWLK